MQCLNSTWYGTKQLLVLVFVCCFFSINIWSIYLYRSFSLSQLRTYSNTEREREISTNRPPFAQMASHVSPIGIFFYLLFFVCCTRCWFSRCSQWDGDVFIIYQISYHMRGDQRNTTRIASIRLTIVFRTTNTSSNKNNNNNNNNNNKI